MSRRRPARIHGVLTIDKALGLTSREVVNRAGRLLSERRCGHAGTLDPDASGVLVVAFGEGTKIVRWLMNGPKQYEAEICFGSATLSDDAASETIASAPVPEDLAQRLETTLSTIEAGPIAQVPPIVSALKSNGVRDHERVRRGETVIREPRQVTLYGAELLSVDSPRARVRVSCGPGFYIRAWARDLGLKLGTRAHLTALRRVQSSGVRVEDALTLETLEAMSLEEREKTLRPVGEALSALLPTVEVDDEVGEMLIQGKRPAAPDSMAGENLARLSNNGQLIAVVKLETDTTEPADRRMKVVRGFNQDFILR